MWLWYAGYSHNLWSKGELSWHQDPTCLMSRQTTVYTNQVFTWPCAPLLLFCTEGDTARDDVFADICLIQFMVWSSKGEEKGILILKGTPSIFSLIISTKTCPRWNTDVGWRSGGGSGGLISAPAHHTLKPGTSFPWLNLCIASCMNSKTLLWILCYLSTPGWN